MGNKMTKLDFNELLKAIHQVHDHIANQANRAVNISLTLRNWIIGYYIREYEQNGADRAEYGEKLLTYLAAQLDALGVTGCSARSLRQYRQFYLTYPEIRQTLSAKSGDDSIPTSIWQSLSAKLEDAISSDGLPSKTAQQSVSPAVHIDTKRLISSLSFSHFTELIAIDDPLKRAFYEFECIRGSWSVRELKRQIGSLYYERSGLSNNKQKLAEMVQAGVEQKDTKLAIRDPYIFEFLGIKSREVMHESDLEDALLDKLQDFLLELGHGFCFEARQKRILIGNTYNFVDLVFYHRVLKCHVLIELKVESFTHENLGQLNTYISWYRKNVMTETDNPPVGLLLCTRKDNALVEYALAGMDNSLFVSKYQLELPNREDIQRFLEKQIREAGDQHIESDS